VLVKFVIVPTVCFGSRVRSLSSVRMRKVIGQGSAQAFAFKNTPYLLVCGLQTVLRKPDVCEAVNVGELGTAVLEKDDRAFESQSALKEPGLMDHVLARMGATVRVAVLIAGD